MGSIAQFDTAISILNRCTVGSEDRGLVGVGLTVQLDLQRFQLAPGRADNSDLRLFNRIARC
jgi:hypothetical protein